MYHWEADQEDFLVVAGEALLIVEGEERPLRQWDFVHCPPEREAHDRRRRSRARASSSRSARASTRTGRAGAATRSTRSRSVTGPASSRRRPCRTRRTPPSERSTARAPRRRTATAGFPVPSSVDDPAEVHARARRRAFELAAYANICSLARDHPPRRPRRVLRLGRAARRSAPARATRDRRRRGRARRELRGEGVRHQDGDGRPPGAPALPARDRRAAADVGLLRGEQGRLRGLRGHDAARRGALHRRGVPRRPRARTARRAAAARSQLGCGERVLDEVGLPITVGIARTKFLAKVASAVAKPNGLLVVPPDDELGFLHPLPVERLWGVGRVTAAKLHDRGLRTVGQVAALDEALLVALLGRASGRHLHALAHNRDPRPVQTGRRRRSIGSQRALGRRPKSLRGDRLVSSSRSSTASRGGCARAGDGVAPSFSASASTTSRARRGRSRCLD